MRSPILFLAFNRPMQTQRVFDVIRNVRPSRLYLSLDGPRTGKPGEIDQCKAVQKIVSKVDWPCDVHSLVHEKNLGCKLAVSQALDWFFAAETEGIILEDDCLPHPDFFSYCDALLERYRDDQRIGLISGTAFGDLRKQQLVRGSEDYLFTRYPSIWGWASWRRVWKHYDADIKFWEIYRQDVSALTCNPKLRKTNETLFDRVVGHEIDTWDYQVSFMLWSASQLSVVPRFNLIENIGFGADATHTKTIHSQNIQRSKMGEERLTFPLVAPELMVPNYHYQQWIEKFATRPFLFKLLSIVKDYVFKKPLH